MIESFLQWIAVINRKINLVNFALMKIERDIAEYVFKYPETVCFDSDPTLDIPIYIAKAFPSITFRLPPFEAALSYEEIFARINDTEDVNIIQTTIIDILCERYAL